MTKLYPIGTLLITTELWKAALLDTIFGDVETLGEYYEFENVKTIWMPFLVQEEFLHGADIVQYDGKKVVAECESLGKYGITVTEENQKWLSLVPIVGDLLEYKTQGFFLARALFDKKRKVSEFSRPLIEAVDGGKMECIYYSDVCRIIERTYPNGQRLPFITFEEVEEPE